MPKRWGTAQANRWSELSPSGGSPAARTAHAAAWLDTADGFYIFGGWSGSSGPRFGWICLSH